MHPTSKKSLIWEKLTCGSWDTARTPRPLDPKNQKPQLKDKYFDGALGWSTRDRRMQAMLQNKTLNRRAIANLVSVFSPEALADLVYVADSSLVTSPNLAVLHQKGLGLISRRLGTPMVGRIAARSRCGATRLNTGSPTKRASSMVCVMA